MISKIIPEEKIQQAKKWMDEAENIVIVSHSSPDGDAVGSSLALSHFLYEIDKNVSVIYPDAFPDFLSWIAGSENAVIYSKNKEDANELLANADLIFALDFNVLTRIGDMANAVDRAPAKKIMLDHHPFPGHFCQLIISHPEISSTSEMVFRLICRMGHRTDINIPCAEAIYTGMMTDTGAFTFNSNNAEIYLIISELIKIGINKDEIYDNVYNNYSADRYRLMGYLLSEKMRVYPEYNAALISLTKKEKRKYNYQSGDAEGFVNLPLSIKGIVFSVIFKEEEDKIRISLRSKGDFPVNEIAEKYFNGGGHRNASGGESDLSINELISLFEEILPKYKNQLANQKDEEQTEDEVDV